MRRLLDSNALSIMENLEVRLQFSGGEHVPVYMPDLSSAPSIGHAVPDQRIMRTVENLQGKQALATTPTYRYSIYFDAEALGISGTTLVGQYHLGSPDQEGFIYNETTGVFTPVQYPGGSNTKANGVSDSTIIGTYGDSNGIHGFTYNENTGNYTTLDDPNANIIDTFLNGISGTTIVGDYIDMRGRDFGFIYNETTGIYTTLGVPNDIPSGVSGSTVVGSSYGRSSRSHGFIYDEATATYTTLNDPNAMPATTVVSGISGSRIVGYYYNRHERINGFIYDERTGVFTPLRIPNGEGGTQISGISDSTIVGSYVDPNDPVEEDAFIGGSAPSISGIIFNDRNGDGIRDSHDRGLSDITVMLQQLKHGKPIRAAIITATDSAGDYSFTGLSPVAYRVTELLPGNSTLTTPQTGSYTIVLVPGQISDGNNFGDHLRTAPSVTSVVRGAANETGTAKSLRGQEDFFFLTP